MNRQGGANTFVLVKENSMKQITIFMMMFLIGMPFAFSQNYSQTVRGKIIDIDSRQTIIGAQVVVVGSNPLIGAVSDIDGNYRLESVPSGRVTVQVSFIGYQSQTLPNVVVNSGKEVILDLALTESVIKINEVVISATENKGDALNEMALVSARSISAEQTTRYAGNFGDPSRIMSNFAGVTNTQDGGNDIIVRGNSPKYVQWRLEGVDITNPNHFGDQSGVGGSISTLNNNLLANSDFYTGAFTAEYGNVLSGVYDVKLRAGNNEKFEASFGIGLLGTEVTAEGPFKKGYKGSYLVNYRYSTVTMASDLGLVDVDGTFNFQDAAFKIVLPTKNFGQFSMFGIGGKSNFLLEDVTPQFWNTPGNNFMKSNISEDFDKRNFLMNIGIKNTLPINNNSFLSTTLAYSNEGNEDEVIEKTVFSIYDGNGEFLRDSTLNEQKNFDSKLNKSNYNASLIYHNKINTKNKLVVGLRYKNNGYEFKQSHLQADTNTRIALVDFNENIRSLSSFVSWKHRINENATIVAGLQNFNVLFNNEHTIEPRLAINYKLNNRISMHAGYGLHSTMESVHHYYAKVPQSNGNLIEPNLDLGLLKAHHGVFGVKKRFGKSIQTTLEAYYQHLFDLPVAADSSYFSTINEGLEFTYVDLVNEGKGKNYGLELTLERFFSNKYYYMLNGSVYQSKYTALDGVERNTQFNNNYLINVLAGKEFNNLGKKNNQTLVLNFKAFLSGGKKIIPLLRDDNGNLNVDADNNQFYDYSKAYVNSIEDTYYIVLAASYKWNRPKATHELFLDLNNITNKKGKINEYYDEKEPGNIGYQTQFGIFPNLMYRVYF